MSDTVKALEQLREVASELPVRTSVPAAQVLASIVEKLIVVVLMQEKRIAELERGAS